MKIFLAIVIHLLLFSPALARDTQIQNIEAIDILQENTEALLAIVASKEYHLPQNHDKMKKEAENIVMQLFSFEDFTKLAIGKKWNSFTDTEKQCLTKACTNLLRSSYVDYLDDYDKQVIEFISSTKANNGSRAQVDAIVFVDNSQVPLSFRMLTTENGNWKVYDVLIEGISLVKNYRTQFAELLLNKSPEEVAHIIEEKNISLIQEKEGKKE